MTDTTVRIGRPPQGPPRKLKPEWVIAAAVLIAVSLLVIVAAVSDRLPGIGSGGHIDVTGNVWLPDGGASFSGSQCTGKGGYDDIRQGAQVVVTDASGTTIAIGQLDYGSTSSSGCRFPFKVTGVPGGHDFYGVEVTHRGRLQYDAERIKQPLALSLGG